MKARVWFTLKMLLVSLWPLAQVHAEVKELTLMVAEGTLELNGVQFQVWTLNGTIPGPPCPLGSATTPRWGPVPGLAPPLLLCLLLSCSWIPIIKARGRAMK